VCETNQSNVLSIATTRNWAVQHVTIVMGTLGMSELDQPR